MPDLECGFTLSLDYFFSAFSQVVIIYLTRISFRYLLSQYYYRIAFSNFILNYVMDYFQFTIDHSFYKYYFSLRIIRRGDLLYLNLNYVHISNLLCMFGQFILINILLFSQLTFFSLSFYFFFFNLVTRHLFSLTFYHLIELADFLA